MKNYMFMVSVVVDSGESQITESQVREAIHRWLQERYAMDTEVEVEMIGSGLD
jgi:hypothetical protein